MQWRFCGLLIYLFFFISFYYRGPPGLRSSDMGKQTLVNIVHEKEKKTGR